MKYVVIYERGPENWGAFAPDLPGYGATAASLEELRELVREGIPLPAPDGDAAIRVERVIVIPPPA